MSAGKSERRQTMAERTSSQTENAGSPSDRGLRLHVVSHTHWDREWYLTFQHFRERLVRLVDRLIGIFRDMPEYACFVLDGQTVALEDYLQLRPENRTTLAQSVGEGRLIIGPWFVSPDLFCVSGESLVRNLQKGMSIARSFGRCQMVGYMVDQFGLNSQMPQILLGFGIDKAIAWRGIFSTEEEKADAVLWSSPDGSTVLLGCLPDTEGYYNACKLSSDFDKSLKVFEHCVDSLQGSSKTGDLLLMNGVDHSFPLADLPQVIRNYANLFPGTDIRQSSPEEYLDRISVCTQRLKLAGELRNSAFNDTMRGVLSARNDLKVRNEQVEGSLVYQAEPISVMARVFAGREYPSALLEEAWRVLLLNHAHDSIGGVSIDQVHREMYCRFDQAAQISALESELSACAISKTTQDPAGADCKIVVFNSSFFQRSGLCRSTLLLPGEPETREKGYRIFDGDRQVDFAVLKRCPPEVRFIHDESFFRSVVPVEIEFPVEGVPAFGYKTLSLRWVDEEHQPEAAGEPAQAPFEVVGEKIDLCFNADGTIDLSDKRTGECYRGLNRFIDGGDRGDAYNFCRPEKDVVRKSTGERLKITRLHHDEEFVIYRVSQELRVPVGLGPDRSFRLDAETSLSLSSIVTFFKRGTRVDIQTTVKNAAKDHRLKVTFPTGRDSDTELAETQFDLVRRDCDVPPREDWFEHPQPEKPRQNVVLINDDRGGLAIAGKGLLEYAVSERPERAVELTLLRCVEWGSRGDLYNTRRGKEEDEAGRAEQIREYMHVRDAQMHGDYTFEYAVIPLTPSAPVSEALLETYSHKIALTANLQKCEGRGTLDGTSSLMSIEPPDVMATALKGSTSDGYCILRLCNLETEPKTVTLKTIRPASVQAADLLDNALPEDGEDTVRRIDDRSWSLTVGEKKIVTLRITF